MTKVDICVKVFPMNRRVFLLVLALIFLTSQRAYAFWIWTPKSGKWVNPKSIVKPNPKEQFDFAKGFYDEKKYKEAEREFKKLLKSYPKSYEASESQYYLGRIQEDLDNPYEAYLAYQNNHNLW